MPGENRTEGQRIESSRAIVEARKCAGEISNNKLKAQNSGPIGRVVYDVD